MEQCLRVSPSLRQRPGDRAPSSHTGFSRSLLPSSTASSFLKVTVYLSTADIHIGPRLAFGKESKDRPDTAPPTSAASRTRLSRGRAHSALTDLLPSNAKTSAVKCKRGTPEWLLARGLYPYFWKTSLIFIMSAEFLFISTFAAFMKQRLSLLSKLALSRRVLTSSFFKEKKCIRISLTFD